LFRETAIPIVTKRDITVIGGSAGSLPVLQRLLADLPANYPAAVFIVLHIPPESPGLLAHLLDRRSVLPVRTGRDGAHIMPSTITVAPPDMHLILERDMMVLSCGPRENAHRPAIDVLFRSAAVAFGSRVTGVLLSGMLDDGAAGMWAIKRRGGVTVVQHPDDAEFPDMPRSALAVSEIDHAIPARELAATLVSIAANVVDWPAVTPPPAMAREVSMAAQNDSDIADIEALGRQVPFTCPECGGSLWQLEDGGPRFRCHVGHAYSLRTFANQQIIAVEAALWAALRSLEQSQRLAEKMAQDARGRGSDRAAEYQTEVMRAHASHADTLRQLLAGAIDSTTRTGT
jgi:two-component system chemotaxis response regulator CheB